MNTYTKYFIGILIALTLVTIHAQATSATNSTEFKSYQSIVFNMDGAKEYYNDNLNRAPAFIHMLFGNERIHITVIRNDGTEHILNIETKKGVVVQFTEEEIENYTLNAPIKESTIDRILTAKDDISEFQHALRSKEITYESLRMRTSFKINTFRVASKISNWFTD